MQAGKASILIVDDTADNIDMLCALLGDDYETRVALSGEKALRIAAAARPDLILLDVMMPGMNGYEVCRRLKEDPATRHIPIVFITAMGETKDEKLGLELGAVDYIVKPFSQAILAARLRTHLNQKDMADFLRDRNAFLEQEVGRRTAELQSIQDVTIMAMASLAETRDNETGNHIRRTQHFVCALAHRLKDHPRFAVYLTDANIDTLFKSAPLHDIGKVGIPDRILLKPGRLDRDEFEIMKTHTTLGRDAIEHAESQLGVAVAFLACAKEIAYSHQEKWDGSGYPQGLAGEAIPISARLMALADVYDALTCRRVYKAAMPHEQAAEIIREGRGSHFDPDIVDAFIAIQDEFLAVARRYRDSDAHLQELRQRIESGLAAGPEAAA